MTCPRWRHPWMAYEGRSIRLLSIDNIRRNHTRQVIVFCCNQSVCLRTKELRRDRNEWNKCHQPAYFTNFKSVLGLLPSPALLQVELIPVSGRKLETHCQRSMLILSLHSGISLSLKETIAGRAGNITIYTLCWTLQLRVVNSTTNNSRSILVTRHTSIQCKGKWRMKIDFSV